MKYRDLKSMPETELEEKIKELRMELIKSNAQIATGTNPKSPGKVRDTKKTISKIMTVLAIKNKERMQKA
ncbi:MAG: 50S ribosomal protein L29 [archaeon]